MATKAAAYLRVSGLGQVDGGGLDRQRECIGAYAKRAGLTIEPADWFTDPGVSGTKELADRPGLAALLDRLESNGVRIVLVERSDRLARDLLVGEVILSQFRKAGVKVFEASGVELTAASDDPTSKLIRQVLGAVSEFDKSVTVMKLRAARVRIRRSGAKCEGRKAYGERPGEAQVVSMVRKMHRKPRGGERMSFAQIASALTEREIPTRYGKPWNKATIRSILARV